MLNMDETLDNEDFFMILDEVEVQNSPCKSRSREDVSSKFRCRQAVDNEFSTCVTCHGQLRMRTMTQQTNSYSS